jgi:hypothetical protein
MILRGVAEFRVATVTPKQKSGGGDGRMYKAQRTRKQNDSKEARRRRSHSIQFYTPQKKERH